MLSEMGYIIAAFTAPESIGTTPESMLWMFPLFAAVAIVYKATKMRVIFLGKFFREVVILFLTISAIMIITGLALHAAMRILTV